MDFNTILQKFTDFMIERIKPENLFNSLVFLAVLALVASIPFIGVPIVVLITLSLSYFIINN